LSLAFLVPLAYIVKVQCSVLLMLLMFYRASKVLRLQPAVVLRLQSNDPIIQQS